MNSFEVSTALPTVDVGAVGGSALVAGAFTTLKPDVYYFAPPRAMGTQGEQ